MKMWNNMKSAMGLNVALNMANNKHKGAFFSIEMSREDVGYRLTANTSGLALSDLIDARLRGDHEVERFIKTAGHIANLPLKVYERFHRPNDIVRQIRKLKRTWGLDFVVVDYLQRMTFEGAKSM